MREGVQSAALQLRPHLVLLSRAYYDSALRPLLARWAMVYLRRTRSCRNSFGRNSSSGGGLGASARPFDRFTPEAEAAVLAYITGAPASSEAVAWLSSPDSEGLVHGVTQRCWCHLNLARQWLCTSVPHVLSMINRVSYGLLQPQDQARLAARVKAGVKAPKSRTQLAVPFDAKDVPSRASEFAHPEARFSAASAHASPHDRVTSHHVTPPQHLLTPVRLTSRVHVPPTSFRQVLLGLTTLAYLYEGLRASDVQALVVLLKRQLERELGPFAERPSRALFDRWLAAAHADKLRAKAAARAKAKELSRSRRGKPSAAASAPPATSPRPTLARSTSTTNLAGAAAGDNGGGDNDAGSYFGILPLEVLRAEDPAQLEAVYLALRHNPRTILWYLSNVVFPSPVMHQQVCMCYACG